LPENVVVEPELGYFYTKDEVLVSLTAGAKEADLLADLRGKGVTAVVAQRYPSIKTLLLEVSSHNAVAARHIVSNAAGVETAGLNRIHVAAVYNDSVLTNSDTLDDWGLHAIKADAVWSKVTGRGVRMGIVDSGCQLQHEDLARKFKSPYSYATRSANMQYGTFVDDGDVRHYTFHGTHVAGTAGGIGNNGTGIVGVAPDADIVPIQALVYDRSANAPVISTATSLSALTRAINSNCQVINMSYGTGYSSSIKAMYNRGGQARAYLDNALMNGYTNAGGAFVPGVKQELRLFRRVLNLANARNVILVKSAGNDDLPAKYDSWCYSGQVVSVAATTACDRRASFSNFGKYAVVSAPGQDIYSAAPGNPKYQYSNGTSMAAPHVTGAIALLKQVKPSLKVAEARRLLVSTGTPVTSDYGKAIGPLINVQAALAALGVSTPPAPPRPDACQWVTAPSPQQPPDRPSPLGGVYLAGAGKLLQNLGPVQGVVMSENGEIILLGADDENIALPDLPIDAVVAIFRGVYEKRQSPFISIDPPEGDMWKTHFHRVRQAEVSEDNYVGWVLYEADRIMKSYSTGSDINARRVSLNVPDFQKTLLQQFGPSKGSRRFWFEPDDVVQRNGDAVSLLQIPIRIRTAPTNITAAGFEDDPTRTSSPGAIAFAKWFTTHYDAIARECVKPAPSGSANAGRPVNIYFELKRLAAITGLAEVLLERGIPLPDWMRSYQVAKCDVPDVTPVSRAYTIDKSKVVHPLAYNQTVIKANGRYWNMIGGVALAIPAESKRVIENDATANAVQAAVTKAAAAAPFMKTFAFQASGKRYKAVKLPGAQSKSFGAAKLAHTDVHATLDDGFEFKLVRRYDSLQKPRSRFGGMWTFDLPTMPKTGGYKIESPLGRHNETFPESAQVPEFGPNWSAWRPAGDSRYAAMVVGNDSRLQEKTDEVYLKSGDSFHFDSKGRLRGKVTGRNLAAYEWKDGSLTAIELWSGAARKLRLTLQYNADGNLVSVQSGGKVHATYTYNAAGQLAAVEGASGRFGYQYQNGFVAGVAHNGIPLHAFEYNASGVLTRDKQPSGIAAPRIEHRDGLTTLKQSKAGRVQSATTYDANFRLTKFESNGVVMEQAEPGNSRHFVVRNAAGETVAETRGSKITLKTPAGDCTVHSAFCGKVDKVTIAGDTVFQAEYDPHGQLRSTKTAARISRFFYHDNGAIDFIRDENTADATWIKTQFDENGKAKSITPSSGPVQTVAPHRGDGRTRPSDMQHRNQQAKITRKFEGGAVRFTFTENGQQSAAPPAIHYNNSTGELRVTGAHSEFVVKFDRTGRVTQRSTR